MKLDNGLISGRQCRRTLFLELFGNSVFVLTGLMVSKSGDRCFSMLVFGGAVVFLMSWMIWLLSLKQTNNQDYGQLISECYPKTGWIFMVLYYIRFVFRGGFLTALFYQLLHEFLLQDMNVQYIVIPFVLICAYGAGKGREKRLRGMEMLFWFVLVPFVLILLLVAKDGQSANLTTNFSLLNNGQSENMIADFSLLNNGIRNWLPLFIPLAFYSNVEFGFFLFPMIRRKDAGFRNASWPVLGALAGNFLVLLLSVAVLGYKECAHISWPALRVMQSAKIPGGFIERLDILIVAVWIFAVFSVVSGCIFYSKELCHRLFSVAHNRNVDSIPGILGVYLGCQVFLQSQNILDSYLIWSLLVDIPLGIVSAAFIFLKKSRIVSKAD